MDDRCDPSTLLRRRGLRATPQRVTLLAGVLATTEPFTVADLLDACPDLGADPATAYRFLHRLCTAGLVREILAPGGEGSFGAGRVFEKACPHNPPHPHFACRSCGALSCLRDRPGPPPGEDPLESRGFRVEEVRTTLVGLCPRCAASGGDVASPDPGAERT